MSQPAEQTKIAKVTKISEHGGGSPAFLVVCAWADTTQVGRRYVLDEGELTIGRLPTNGIVIDSETVSREHARIVRRGRAYTLVDCGSANGTYLGDELVDEQTLRSGDLFKIGPAIFKFFGASAPEAAYHQEIYRLAIVDGLTGMANKRAFFGRLVAEMRRAVRYGRPLSLLMFDIDDFKRTNETFGHMGGDHVLQKLADLVKDQVREEDLLARYGGEEFGLILPETNKVQACEIAMKLRGQVEEHHFVFGDGFMEVTISVGAVEFGPGINTQYDFVRAVEEKLNEAKRLGRNRVAC